MGVRTARPIIEVRPAAAPWAARPIFGPRPGLRAADAAARDARAVALLVPRRGRRSAPRRSSDAPREGAGRPARLERAHRRARARPRAPARRSSRATRSARSCPRRPRSSRSPTRRCTSSAPDYRIETDVLGEGELDGTTWRGDLVLKGFGDPTLSTRRPRALARGVRELGIRRVTGGVVGDESYFDARRTRHGLEAVVLIYESPPLSALDRRPRQGTAGARRANPALAAAALFQAALRAAGVVVGGRSRVGAHRGGGLPLAIVDSPPLALDRPLHGPSRATTSPPRSCSSSSARRRPARHERAGGAAVVRARCACRGPARRRARRRRVGPLAGSTG